MKNIQNEKILVDQYSRLLDLEIIKIFPNKKEKEIEFSSKFLVNKHIISNCFECSKKFSFFIKKFHCKICGNLFCQLCLNYEIKINKEQSIKICKKCFNTLKIFLDKIINYFYFVIDNGLNFFSKSEFYSLNYDLYNNIIQDYLKLNNNNDDKNDKYKFNEMYEILIKILINNVLITFMGKNVRDKFIEKLYVFIIEIMNVLRPNGNFFNDKNNINKCVKIKILNYNDYNNYNNKNDFINKFNKPIFGYVCCNKIFKEKIEINNPKILLCLNKSFKEKIKNNQNLNEYYQILKNKIDSINIDIIITYELLPKELTNIIKPRVIVINKKKIFKIFPKIFDTISIPSLDILTPKIILGKCEKFESILNNKNESLLIFSGGNKHLYSTIVLIND